MLEETIVKKDTEKVAHTERELKRHVPASVHDNYGGKKGEGSVLPEQVQHDARETKEKLQEELHKD